MLMSSLNNCSAYVPIETSERNEHCISEETLRSLTEAIDTQMVEGAHKSESKSSSVCIYRVPKELRKLKKSAYTPCFVSIGPLHSKDKHILKSPVQDVKRSYANSLFDRMSSKGSEEELKSTVLMKCVGQMRESLDKAKKCYAEEVEEVLNEEMLVIDGCFILELLYRFRLGQSNERSDPIFGSILTAAYVQHDLLLLENQLPFFVLNKLFDLTLAHIAGKHRPLSYYVISYFCNMRNSEENGTTPTPKNNHYHHMLHILHHHFRPHDVVAANGMCLNKFIPSASDLEYAGVKFQVSKKVTFNEPKSPFNRAIFEIPPLIIEDSTEPFLRNLIAFEQCCHDGDVKPYFTSYAIFMDKLINTPKDVEVLDRAGILSNCLGANEDVSNLFNNLCKETVLMEFYFDKTITDAVEYSKRGWPDAMAYLRRKYFASPWTFIAFCVGFTTFGFASFKFIRGFFP